MDPLSTIASVAGLLQAISAACVTINTISNLPKAFDHVKKHLPLVRKTLEEMRNRIERRKLTEEEECTIVGILDDCAAKTQRLKQIFDALEMRCKRETHIRSWDKLRVWYIEALRGIKGHRVESLMNDILDDIKRLSLYETFWLATQEDVSEITKALEEISHTEPSLNDAAVEYTSVAYATQYVNTGGMGQQNNPSGGSNTFNSGYNISGGTVVIGSLKHEPTDQRSYWGQTIAAASRHYVESERQNTNRYYVDGSSQLKFVGRQDLLARLKASLLPSYNDPGEISRRIFMLHGLGGSGKTEVALRFAEHNRDSFWATLMVDARSPGALEQTFRNIAEQADLLSLGNSNVNPVQVVARWLASLRKERNWLLIFDGANDPTIHLEKYFPPGGRGAILVTTTSPAVLSISTVSESLSGLDPGSAAELFLRAAAVETIDHSIPSGAEQICEMVEYLPLAVLQAGSVIRNGGCTLDEFPDKLATYQRLWLLTDEGAKMDSRYNWIYGTWIACRDMIRQQRTAQSVDALEILTVCCLLDHKDVPLKIFRDMPSRAYKGSMILGRLSHGLPFLDTGASRSVNTDVWDIDRIRSAVIMLANYSLVNFDRKFSHFSISRLVHRWISLDLQIHGNDQMRLWAKRAVSSILAKGIQPDCLSRATQKERRRLLPHIETFLNQDIIPFQVTLPEDENAARKYAFTYFETGHYDKAERLYQECVAFCEHHTKSSRDQYLSAMVCLARTLERRGRFKEALQMCTKASEDGTSLETRSALWFRCRQVMALSLKGLGQSTAARKGLIDLLRDQTAAFGPDHESNLETVAILAEVLRREGDFLAAMEKSKLCYEGRRKRLGPDHEETMESARILATAYQHDGKLRDAIALMENVCVARDATLGANHPDTILSLGTLATLLRRQGNYAAAERQQNAVVERLTKVLGPDHPDTLSELNNLASICRHKRQLHDAEGLYRTAYGGYLANENFGPSHPHTLIAKANVAVCLREQGRPDEANTLYEEVLDEYRKNGKDQHPDALNCMINQSALLMERGDFAKAEILAQRAVDGYLANGGKTKHYYYALTMVSKTIQKQERYSLAEKKVTEAWRGLLDICGTESPETLDALALLAHIVARQGRPQEARLRYETASKGFARLGHHHHWCHERLRTLEAQERGHGDNDVEMSGELGGKK